MSIRGIFNNINVSKNKKLIFKENTAFSARLNHLCQMIPMGEKTHSKYFNCLE